MEATAALRRGSLSTLVGTARLAARSRSRAFWVVAGITGVAAVLRFATLDLQAYHHDEIVTATRILREGFWHAMDAVGFSESAPPLYYVLAWLWTQLTGTGEWGLRSLSALAGVATVPVVCLAGVEARGRRAGIAAAALAATNPMLLWYSQEARAYALFALLCAVSLLYFMRALRGGARADVVGWGVASALALATHYFAIFPVAAEAAWLWRRRRSVILPGAAIVLAAGLLLAPLALHQMALGHADWIGNPTLAHRLWESSVTFMLGETGDIIARPGGSLPALAPLVMVAAALALLPARGERDERRSAALLVSVSGAVVLLPLLLAVLAPSKDYVLGRNLMPALAPLLVALGIAVTLRRARLLGGALGAALVAFSLAFCVATSFSADLQRPDWRSVAARLGAPEAPRAIVTWTLGEAPLRYYLPEGAFQVKAADGYRWFVHELDFVSDGPAPPVPSSLRGAGFRELGYERIGRLYLRRYAAPGSSLLPLRLRWVRRASLGFRSNGVLLDGIGVG